MSFTILSFFKYFVYKTIWSLSRQHIWILWIPEDKAGTILASREAIVILDLKDCGDVKSCEAVIIVSGMEELEWMSVSVLQGPDGQRRDCVVVRGQKENEIEIRWKTDVAGIYKWGFF